MKKDDVRSEIDEILRTELPDARSERTRITRATGPEVLDVIYSTILFASSIGAFGGLWKLCEVLIKRYADVKVEVSYEADDGSKVKVEYPHRTTGEAAKIMSQHPMRSNAGVLLLVTRTRNEPTHSEGS